MAKNVYGSGLNNVGSYQVSGKPFVTGSTIVSGQEEKIEFPEVTNNVTVRLDTLNVNSLLISASVGYISENNHGMSDGQNYTVTAWYKSIATGSSPTNEDMNDFIFGFADSLPAHSPPHGARPSQVLARSFVTGQTNFNLINDSEAGRAIFAHHTTMLDGEWNYIALVVSSSNSSDYTVSYLINGDHATGSPSSEVCGETHDLTDYDKFFVGGYDGSNQRFEEALFRDVIVWNDALTIAQVTALEEAKGDYTKAAFEPTIEGVTVQKKFWLAPSQNPVDPAPETLTNYGSTGGNFTRTGFTGGDNVVIVNDAPYSSTTSKINSPAKTGASLRVHYRSTGSLPNVETNKHYWTLNSQNEQITMNVKSKEIYLSSDGGDVDYSLHADLTNIPTSRMYQHTGSGVDE